MNVEKIFARFFSLLLCYGTNKCNDNNNSDRRSKDSNGTDNGSDKSSHMTRKLSNESKNVSNNQSTNSDATFGINHATTSININFISFDTYTTNDTKQIQTSNNK